MSNEPFSDTVTFRMPLHPDYTSNQNVINKAAYAGKLILRDNSVVFLPVGLLVLTFGVPEDIVTLLTGFGTQTSASRIQALGFAFTQGVQVNTCDGTLLLHALSGCPSIVKYLFSVGADIYCNGKLRKIPTRFGRTCTALDVSLIKSEEGALLLLDHVSERAYENLVADLTDHCHTSLEVFTGIQCAPRRQLDKIVEIVAACAKRDRVFTLLFQPRNDYVIAKLYVSHGIVYPGRAPNDIIVQELKSA